MSTGEEIKAALGALVTQRFGECCFVFGHCSLVLWSENGPALGWPFVEVSSPMCGAVL